MVSEVRAQVGRGSAGDGWKLALHTTAAGAAFSAVDPPLSPTNGLINLSLNRFLVLRAFLRDETAIAPAVGNANGASATIDVYGWQNSTRRAILLARLVLTAGASQGVSPLPLPAAGLSATKADINEIDTAVYSTGLVAPDVRSYADGSCLIYLDACECAQVFLRCQAIDESMRLILLGKGAADIPARVETAFEGSLLPAGATLTDAVLDDLGGTDIPAPGSGQQYVLLGGEISNASTAQTVRIHTGGSGADPVWGYHTIPANSLNRLDFGAGIACGQNKQILISTGGNYTGRITLRGVKRSL